MIKLLIKTGPFYISSTATLLTALYATGVLQRIWPEDGDVLEEISEEIEGVDSIEGFPQPSESLDLGFVGEQAGATIDFLLLVSLAALAVTAIILLGYLYQRAWERLTRELDGR